MTTANPASLDYLNLGSLPNLLKLFSPTGDVNIDETAKFMEISRNQLAEALGISNDQIRPERMSDKVKQRVAELAGSLEIVAVIFDGNVDKTKFWFKTPNPNLGNSAPRDLITRGRYKRVMDFIQEAYQRKQGRK